MRSPTRRRLAERSVGFPEGTDLDQIAETVTFIGSPDHKDMPSFAGQPRPRADASICPRELTRDRDRVQNWLREGLRRGSVGGMWEGGFPRYVWYIEASQVYEARLVNRGNGEYKGYPISVDELPAGIEALYE